MQILNPDGTRDGVIVDPGLQGADGAPIAHKMEQPPMVSAPPAPGAPRAGPGGAPPPMVPAPDPNDPNSPLKPILAVNPTVGTYDVEADVGPAYATRRQDAFNAMSQILMSNESLVPVIGDMLFQAADFPMADEIAERMRRMVPPQALGDGDPQSKALQGQLAAMQTHLQAAIEELAKVKAERAIEQQEADAKTAANKIAQYKAETDRLSALGTIDPAAMIPVIRSTVAATMADRGIGGPVQIAHPHDPSLAGTMAPGLGLQPIPRTNPPGGPVAGVPGGGQ